MGLSCFCPGGGGPDGERAFRLIMSRTRGHTYTPRTRTQVHTYTHTHVHTDTRSLEVVYVPLGRVRVHSFTSSPRLRLVCSQTCTVGSPPLTLISKPPCTHVRSCPCEQFLHIAFSVVISFLTNWFLVPAGKVTGGSLRPVRSCPCVQFLHIALSVVLSFFTNVPRWSPAGNLRD